MGPLKAGVGKEKPGGGGGNGNDRTDFVLEGLYYFLPASFSSFILTLFLAFTVAAQTLDAH